MTQACQYAVGVYYVLIIKLISNILSDKPRKL